KLLNDHRIQSRKIQSSGPSSRRDLRPSVDYAIAVDVTPEPVEAQMTELRPYQFEVLGQIEQAIAAGQRRILVTLPTGAGKPVCAADIIRRFNERGLFSLFLAHRREIIGQTSQRLTEHGMPLGAHGIIMAERMCDLRPQARIQVASIDTLHARGV